MIAETIRRCCGVASVRDSSTRGASDAVRGLIKALRSGLDLGITPGLADDLKLKAAELKLSLDAITLEAEALVA